MLWRIEAVDGYRCSTNFDIGGVAATVVTLEIPFVLAP